MQALCFLFFRFHQIFIEDFKGIVLRNARVIFQNELSLDDEAKYLVKFSDPFLTKSVLRFLVKLLNLSLSEAYLFFFCPVNIHYFLNQNLGLYEKISEYTVMEQSRAILCIDFFFESLLGVKEFTRMSTPSEDSMLDLRPITFTMNNLKDVN